MKETPLLPGYQLTKKIFQGTHSLIYRGQRETDQQPVVIKFLNSEFPHFDELAHFQNQYHIARHLTLEGVVRVFALERYRHGYALVMEDSGAISLQAYLQVQPLSLNAFFDIALALADILHGLQQNDVIHKDIKPTNI